MKNNGLPLANKNPNYFIAILAGGKSSRFGSNKALFNLNGKAIITRIILEIFILEKPPKEIILSLHTSQQLDPIREILLKDFEIQEHNSTHYHLHYRDGSELKKVLLCVLYDSMDLQENQQQGPLLGFQSIFAHIIEGFVQILPCDMPYFKSEQISLMQQFASYNQFESDAIVPQWENKYIEPLVSIYRVEAFLKVINTNVQNRLYRLRDLFQDWMKIQYVKIEKEFGKRDPKHHPFQNLNERTD